MEEINHDPLIDFFEAPQEPMKPIQQDPGFQKPEEKPPSVLQTLEMASSALQKSQPKAKKRGAPFKGEVRDSQNERNIKEKRSIFRTFKCFYAKGVFLNYGQNNVANKKISENATLNV